MAATPAVCFSQTARSPPPVRGRLLEHPRVSGAVRGPQSRVVPGQGPCQRSIGELSRSARQAPSVRDGSRGRLRPDPMWLGHLMSRDRVRRSGSRSWRRSRCARRTLRMNSWFDPVVARLSPRRPGRAASRTPSRKGMRSAAPEVPSVRRAPFRERLSSQVVPNLWRESQARFRSSFLPVHGRCIEGNEDSARVRRFVVVTP